MATAPYPLREPPAKTGVLPESVIVRPVRRSLGQRIRTQRAAALAFGACAVLLVSALSGWLAHGNTASPPPAQPSHSAPASPAATTNPASTQPTPGRQQADQTTPTKGKGKGHGGGNSNGGGNGGGGNG